MTSPTSESWSSLGYWNKARAYAIAGKERGSPDTGFMYALSLEFLSRAVLTNTHPSLNARPDDDGVSLLHACGFAVPGKPKTVEMHTVYGRIGRMAPETFTPSLIKKCLALSTIRNVELHTADLAFAALKDSDWLPGFYEAVEVLCTMLGRRLDEFFGDDEAAVARDMIQADRGKQSSSTHAEIAAFAKVFAAKSATDKAEAVARAERATAFRRSTPCPACKSPGIVAGRIIRESAATYDGQGTLTVTRTHAADTFECLACGLPLRSLEAMLAAGIEPTFQAPASWDASEDVEAEESAEYQNM